jgi:hypothetical protein
VGRGELGLLGLLFLKLLQSSLEVVEPGLDLLVASPFDLAALVGELLFYLGEILVASILIDARDDVRRELDDLLQVFRGDVEEVPQP